MDWINKTWSSDGVITHGLIKHGVIKQRLIKYGCKSYFSFMQHNHGLVVL